VTLNPIIWIINAPKKIRQAIAGGVFLVLVGMILGVAWLAVSSIQEARQNIRDKREMLGRLQAIATLRPALLQEDSFGVENSADFLEGGNEALARGNLQAKLTAIASAQNANLLSIGNVPDLEINGSRYIGLRVDLAGPMDAVYNVVVAIETAAVVFINEASIWDSGAGQAGGATAPPEISAQIHVYGALSLDLQKLAAGASQ
jgi:hypothetical protein